MATGRPPHHLFVYGTLRAEVDHPMGRRLRQGARAIGGGRIPGRLYDVGPYPALAPPARDGEQVHGEVFALDPHGEADLLHALDVYEGCPRPGADAPLFLRTVVEVTLEDGMALPAWVYRYGRDVGGLQRIRSGRWPDDGSAG